MNFPLQYPVKMSFKLLAVAPQISIRDANNRELMYVRQKLFKLKEEINIFANESQSQRIYGIKADQVLDWSARYHFSDAVGQNLGSLKRHGAASLWKASYDLLLGDQVEFQIREASALVRFLDGVLGEIPFLGMFTGYLFHPAYLATRSSLNAPVMRMVKKPSLLEKHFEIEKVDPSLTKEEEERLLLGLFMLTLLERSRG